MCPTAVCPLGRVTLEDTGVISDFVPGTLTASVAGPLSQRGSPRSSAPFPRPHRPRPLWVWAHSLEHTVPRGGDAGASSRARTRPVGAASASGPSELTARFPTWGQRPWPRPRRSPRPGHGGCGEEPDGPAVRLKMHVGRFYRVRPPVAKPGEKPQLSAVSLGARGVSGVAAGRAGGRQQGAWPRGQPGDPTRLLRRPREAASRVHSSHPGQPRRVPLWMPRRRSKDRGPLPLQSPARCTLLLWTCRDDDLVFLYVVCEDPVSDHVSSLCIGLELPGRLGTQGRPWRPSMPCRCGSPAPRRRRPGDQALHLWERRRSRQEPVCDSSQGGPGS